MKQMLLYPSCYILLCVNQPLSSSIPNIVAPSVRFKGYDPLIVVRPLLFQILNQAGDFSVQLHHHSGHKSKHTHTKKKKFKFSSY